MKKLISAALLVAAAASTPVHAITEGDYYYLPSKLCEAAESVASENKLLTVIGNDFQSQVQINLALLTDYPATGIAYLEHAQSVQQIAIVEKASKTWTPFSQDNMYILGKEKIPFAEASKLPAILASSPERAEAYLAKVEAFKNKFGISDDEIVTVQTGARVLVQDDSEEVFLKNFFTTFDVSRIEKHILSIDHHTPMMESLEVAFLEKRSHGACGIKAQGIAKL